MTNWLDRARLRAIALVLSSVSISLLAAEALMRVTGTASEPAGEGGQGAFGALSGSLQANLALLSDALLNDHTRLVWILVLGLSIALFLRAGGEGQPDLSTSASAADRGVTAGAIAASAPLNSSEMVRLVYTDELTGLPNRRRFEQRLASLIGERVSGRLAIGLIDLDGFKPINDIYGIAAGDEILRQVGLRLEGAGHQHGLVSRFAADDFAFLTPDLATEQEAINYGQVLSEVLGAPYDLENRRVRLSASVGLALFPDAAREPGELIKRAASALYQAKKGEHGKVVIFSKALEDHINESMKIEQALRRAIAEGTIRAHFQPIVDLASQRILGFEALARWTDMELGEVSPARFIPIAEQRGLIGEMTEVLLYQAAREARLWPSDTFLSFNLSTTQLSDPGTALKVLSILSRAGLEPRRLEVEITETALMSDTDTARSIIGELRQTGVRVALDDFGTGYSSLGYLRELDLDKVKIDRSFVADIGRERQSDHIVKAILEMCIGLDLAVVAEGIEERHQASGLRSFGCKAGQGFLFGRPMNAEKARALFETGVELSSVAIH